MVNSLVVGGNGFLGARLADALVGFGHSVTAFDRFSTPGVNFLSESIETVAGDFYDERAIRNAVEGKDFVFHFLNTTTPASSLSMPADERRLNQVPSESLFLACADAGVGKVVFASSGGAIYGDQGSDLCSESDIARPISPYGVSKLHLENVLTTLKSERGLDSVSLRMSNPYGPRRTSKQIQGLIPTVIRQGILGLPVTRFGDGSMIRDYVFVDDLIPMILDVALHASTFDLYNLGSGVGYTVQDVLDRVQHQLGEALDLTLAPTPATYVHKVVLDMSRYENEFGTRELTTLDDGIAQTLTSERQWLAALNEVGGEA